MIKYFASFLLFTLVTFSSKAQLIDSAINIYSNNFPTEKLHLHTDKDTYFSGETIWFKAYLFNGNEPSIFSTNLYTAIYDKDGNCIGLRP